MPRLFHLPLALLLSGLALLAPLALARAIGLRFDAPIFTYENILAEAGIVLTDEEEEEKEKDKPTEKKEPKEKKPKKESSRRSADDLKNYSVDKLNELLKEAIEKEDYEKAAKLRDELGKRN